MTGSYRKWGWHAYWTISYIGQDECLRNDDRLAEEDEGELDVALDGGVGGDTILIALDEGTTEGIGGEEARAEDMICERWLRRRW